MVLEVGVHISSILLMSALFEYFEFSYHIFSFVLACDKSSLTSSLLLTIFPNYIIPRGPLLVVTEVTMLAVVIMFSYEKEEFLLASVSQNVAVIVSVLACRFDLITCGYTLTINSMNLANAQLEPLGGSCSLNISPYVT